MQDGVEYLRCGPTNQNGPAAGFITWCRDYVVIQDKETQSETSFDPFPGQLRVIPDLVDGVWLILLKGRQLGMTWLAVAYCLWRIIYSKYFTVCVINQNLPYAKDFIKKVKWVYYRLPMWSRVEITTDSKETLCFEGGGQVAEIRALAGGDDAARSFTGDLAIVDEASRVIDLKDSMKAIIPTLRRSTVRAKDGQVVMLTTSDGPIGDFADYWDETYGTHGEKLDANGIGPNGFKPFFIHWSERPGRDQSFYDKRKRELDTISRVAIKQEYPNSVEEAFEYAEGRVYTLFTRARNVGDIKIPDYADRCRAIDWGESKSAYVVLWIAHLGGPPGFLVSPKCPETIKEMIGYRLDEHGFPLKKNDHSCDAIRYAVNRHKFTGMVYVYREIHRYDSVARGWNPMEEIQEIHELSGWEKCDPFDKRKRKYRPTRDAEIFSLSAVADRSMGKLIKLFRAYDIPCLPSERPKGPKTDDGATGVTSKSEIIQGIAMVAALIDGSIGMDEYYEINREGEAMKVYYDNIYDKYHSTTGLEERKMIHLARDILKARERNMRRDDL